MDQTWTVRDLPVLRAIVELYEETGQIVSPNQIEAKTGLAAEVVQSALRALDSEQPPYVKKMQRYSSGHVVMIGAPTGHARRAVGAWPTAETIADRLVSALDEAADREPDPERKGWLSKTAAYLGNAGRDLAVEIGATAINRQMGM
jgi:hypothetical protein